jgi:predicted aldo/keto reductase-like oxidoreductase
MTDSSDSTTSISRRRFLATGGAAAAATALVRGAAGEEGADRPRVVRHRTLGRTGFQVSDVSLGGAPRDGRVCRYAYDRGMNYFDSGESYGNGGNERAIGEAMPYMDRSKIFITTKLHLKPNESAQSILDRFSKCQERLRTEYVDGLFIHAATTVRGLSHKGFHEAVHRLKADGRLRHAGVSCHGPRGEEGDSMEDVLKATAEDGRFDLVLMAYGFMNQEPGNRALAALKAKNLGTTAMKVSPGTLEAPPFDPERPSGRYKRMVDANMKRGMSREEAVQMVADYVAELEQAAERSRPMLEEHGVTDKEELRVFAIRWVLANPDMHTVCLRLANFEALDRFVPLSGTQLDRAQAAALDSYRMVHSNHYCRLGCNDCAPSCPLGMPVSTIMRYSYYFTEHGLEKDAMIRYARLADRNASKCADCDAPCLEACPHGVNVLASLLGAHELLTL